MCLSETCISLIIQEEQIRTTFLNVLLGEIFWFIYFNSSFDYLELNAAFKAYVAFGALVQQWHSSDQLLVVN